MEDLDSQIEPTQHSIICGLPDDIALLCLARVPRKYHKVLKCVSRRWRDLVCGEELYSHRRKEKLEETWIYALGQDKSEQFCCYVLDPTSPRRCWKPIEVPPHCSNRQGMSIEVLGKKIYLLGGFILHENGSNEVYLYDASRNTWSEGVPLSTARFSFSCEVVDEKIYVIGGLRSRSGLAETWDAFDPQTSTWSSHPDPTVLSEVKDSFVLDGKIYIRFATPFCSNDRALIYKPSSGPSQLAAEDMASGWRGPAVVVDGTLYVLDQSTGTRLMMWKKDVREWVPVGRLSPLRTRPPCQLVAVGKSIFVVGKGLSTVVLDVGNARNVEGAMVCSYVPELDSVDNVISCKCLAI